MKFEMQSAARTCRRVVIAAGGNIKSGARSERDVPFDAAAVRFVEIERQAVEGITGLVHGMLETAAE